MTTKKLVVLAVIAVALGAAAYFSSSSQKMKTPSLVGKAIVGSFDMSKVAKIDIGGEKKLRLSTTDKGWVIDSLYGYPADITKIRENILKLQDLKVGQMVKGKKMGNHTLVDLQDAAGKSLASIALGESHMRQMPEASQFGGGGYPDGRYVQFGNDVVLVKETLDAFNGDPKSWTDTQIASVPSGDATTITIEQNGQAVKLDKASGAWKMDGLGEKEEFDTSKSYSVESALSYLNFTGVIDPAKTEAELGFATGAVYTVTLKNGQSYTAKVGGTVTNSTDRFVKLSAAFKPVGTNATENAASTKAVETFNAKNGNWTYAIASYSAENLTKAHKDLVKAKEEPKNETSATSQPVKLDMAQPSEKK